MPPTRKTPGRKKPVMLGLPLEDDDADTGTRLFIKDLNIFEQELAKLPGDQEIDASILFPLEENHTYQDVKAKFLSAEHEVNIDKRTPSKARYHGVAIHASFLDIKKKSTLNEIDIDYPKDSDVVEKLYLKGPVRDIRALVGSWHPHLSKKFQFTLEE